MLSICKQRMLEAKLMDNSIGEDGYTLDDEADDNSSLDYFGENDCIKVTGIIFYQEARTCDMSLLFNFSK